MAKTEDSLFYSVTGPSVMEMIDSKTNADVLVVFPAIKTEFTIGDQILFGEMVEAYDREQQAKLNENKPKFLDPPPCFRRNLNEQ